MTGGVQQFDIIVLDLPWHLVLSHMVVVTFLLTGFCVAVFWYCLQEEILQVARVA